MIKIFEVPNLAHPLLQPQLNETENTLLETCGIVWYITYIKVELLAFCNVHFFKQKKTSTYPERTTFLP